MLKKLYAAGSLENTDDGFRFKLRNTLATATITDPPEVFVDGDQVDQAAITFHIGDETIEGSSISDEDTFALTKGAEVTVAVQGDSLASGAHKLRIKVTSKEWDTLDFEVEDTA